jgi:hydroxyacylglutathione hydrolase
MLQLIQFTFNPFGENTYLWVNEKKECWITDPGMYGAEEESVLTKYIAAQRLKPQFIFNTHAHIDHILGVDALKQKYNIRFGVHKKELPILENAVGSAMMFGFNFRVAPQPDFFIEENTLLQLGEDVLEIRFVPGHSPGSIAFYYPEGGFVVSGDVLFQHSVGRTDLPGSNPDDLMTSIKKQLYTLPDATKVYSGHGSFTTVREEKKVNPFVRG